MLNLVPLQKFLEGSGFELPPVVDHQDSRDAEAAKDVFPDKIGDPLLRDCGQGFSFNPFGEVVTGQDDPLSSTRSCRKRSQDINSPLSKWDWGLNRGQPGGWLPWDVGVELAGLAFFHKFCCIFLESWLVKSLTQNLVSQRSSFEVISTLSFMDLTQGVLGFILPQAY